MGRPDARVCLTCGGPAWLCATSDRCVAADIPAIRPPSPNADVFRRTPSDWQGAGWLKLLGNVVALLPLVVVVRGLDTPGAPLLVFFGVPYAALVAWATYAAWRPKNVGQRSMPWLP